MVLAMALGALILGVPPLPEHATPSLAPLVARLLAQSQTTERPAQQQQQQAQQEQAQQADGDVDGGKHPLKKMQKRVLAHEKKAKLEKAQDKMRKVETVRKKNVGKQGEGDHKKKLKKKIKAMEKVKNARARKDEAAKTPEAEQEESRAGSVLRAHAPDADLSSANKTTFKALSLKEINRIYESGAPSNNIRQAGLVIHMKDDTEEFGPGGLVHPGDRQFQEFWATSIVNKNMPGMYKDSCGLIIAPQAADVMCSFYQDYTSWNNGCKPDYLFKPDKLEEMLNISLALQKGGAAGFDGRYNEVIINSSKYRSSMPSSVAAVFFTDLEGADPSCAVNTHQELVRAYGLKPHDVLLLKHTPGGSPGFVEHDPEEVADIPGGACRSVQDNVEDAWCMSNCAVGNCPEAMCECDEAEEGEDDEAAKLRRQRLVKVAERNYWWAAAEPTKRHKRTASPTPP